MTKHIRLALIASACLLLPGATETHAQHSHLSRPTGSNSTT